MTVKKEIRFFEMHAELRATQGAEFALTGYAAVFNSLSREIAPGVKELIKPGAFTRVLASDPDVVCRYQHDDSRVLGRTTNGTLTLAQDEKGLSFRCPLDKNNPEHVNIHAMVGRGDVAGASFAFSLNHNDGDDEYRNGKDETGAGCIVRTIKNFSALHDVAIVVHSAYPAVDSAVSARSLAYRQQETVMSACVARARRSVYEHEHSLPVLLEKLRTVNENLKGMEQRRGKRFAEELEQARAEQQKKWDSDPEFAAWKASAEPVLWRAR